MHKIGVLFLTFLLSNAAAYAEYPQPPLEAYGALPQIGSAELSPDGTKVAAIANIGDGTRAIVIELSGGVSQQIGIERSKARGIDFYDNEHIILRASTTTHTYGFRGEYEYSGAFSINIDSLETNQLLYRARDLYPAQSGLGRIVGRSDKPGKVLMPAYIGKRGADPRLDLLTAELDSRRASRYMRGTNDTIDWFVGDGGRVLARERYDNKTNAYLVQWRTGEKWTTIFEEKVDVPDMSIRGVMPDESGLVFAQYFGTGSALMKLGSDGEITGPVIADRNRQIETIYTDNNRTVLGVRFAGIIPDYEFLDPQLQDSFESVSEKLPEATIYIDSWSDDRNKILYNVFDPGLGDVWIVHSRDADDLSVVASSRPDIPANAMGVMMNIEYKARDGLTIQAVLTVPPDYDPETTGPLPTLAMPHGGPASYDRYDFDWMAQYFANRGYAVIQPNFRGSTGFGRKFLDAGRGEWGAKMQDDITDGQSCRRRHD
ncbi:MAG: prolyl oligopeptidase family serine peptidase [Pseudomonadota bacterium]